MSWLVNYLWFHFTVGAGFAVYVWVRLTLKGMTDAQIERHLTRDMRPKDPLDHAVIDVFGSRIGVALATLIVWPGMLYVLVFGKR